MQRAHALDNEVELALSVGKMRELRQLAAAARRLRHEKRNCVFIRHFRRKHLAGEGARQGHDFGGVAVIDLEHRRTAARLDPHIREAEAQPRPREVDALGIVIEHEQRIDLRIDHLRHQLQPLRLEIVPLVDQYRAVLRPGDLPAIDAANDRVDKTLEVFLPFGVRPGHVIQA